MSKRKTLIIIPAYNEASTIIQVIAEIKLQKIQHLDILVVNDASKDKTSELAKTQDVTVIDLICNLGIGGAVQTGYIYALRHGYDIAIQFDGDNQHSAGDLPIILQAFENSQADSVIGSRFLEGKGFQSSFWRRLGILFFSKTLSLFLKQRITDPTSGLRLANKKVIQLFVNYYPNDYAEPEALIYLHRNKARVHEISVTMKHRSHGKSSIQFIQSVYYLVKVSLAIFMHLLRQRHKGNN